MPPAPPLPAGVLARLDAAESLRGPRTVHPLDGGLTNLNYVVTTSRGRFVARLAGATGDLLSIDRDAEAADSRAAASTGVAPAVVEYVPEARLLVVEWLEGLTLTPADLHREDVLARAAAACRTLHAGPRFTRDFDMFAVTEGYLAAVRAQGYRMPADWLDFQPQVRKMRRALAATAGPTVPCNNDLLAGNLIDQGDRIRLIDWEYAGNNDPCFELGNLWSESTLPPELLDVLIAEYYGEPHPRLVARARLLALMAKYGWMLWAAIQAGASTLDFDFWSWGMEKYDRAVAEFTSPAFATWIADLTPAPEGAPCPNRR